MLAAVPKYPNFFAFLKTVSVLSRLLDLPAEIYDLRIPTRKDEPRADLVASVTEITNARHTSSVYLYISFRVHPPLISSDLTRFKILFVLTELQLPDKSAWQLRFDLCPPPVAYSVFDTCAGPCRGDIHLLLRGPVAETATSTLSFSLVFPTSATCPTHPSVLDFIT